MLLIISPSKTMDLKPQSSTKVYTQPVFLNKAEVLVKQMKKLSLEQLSQLLSINPQLAQLNFERYQQWQHPFTTQNANQAIFTFKGEVFNGLDVDSMYKKDILFAQKHLRILSGLYGILNPLDLIQPYRLDIADRLNVNGQSLYKFWKQDITQYITDELSGHKNPVLVNLASNEYFKGLDTKNIPSQIITPVFKEAKGNSLKIVTMYAKKARGMMARFIIQNQIDDIEQIKLFDKEGYYFNDRLSAKHEFVFTR